LQSKTAVSHRGEQAAVQKQIVHFPSPFLIYLLPVMQAAPAVAKRGMAGLSGSVIELSNYLEQRISQKSAEYAAVSAISRRNNCREPSS
jgi:hypothetical protein